MLHKHHIVTLCFAFFSLLLGHAPLAAFPGAEKILDPSLLDVSEKGERPVIVTLRQKGTGLGGLSGILGGGGSSHKHMNHALVDEVLGQIKALPFSRVRRFDNIPAFTATMGGDAIKALAGLHQVAAIEDDPPMILTTRQGLAQIQCTDALRDSPGGEGVAVAVLDTGVNYHHPLLGGGAFPNALIIGGVDISNNDNDPLDHNGHGSSCIAIVAGTGRHEDFVGGVAPRAKIMAVKVFADDGTGNMSDAYRGMDWCISHQNDNPDAPIMIISMSLGSISHDRTTCKDPGVLRELMKRLTERGIAVFAASGNDADIRGLALPACSSQVVSVGAVYDNDFDSISFGQGMCVDHNIQRDSVTCYSNSSPLLDLLAPSHCCVVPGAPGNAYMKCFGGTSTACPYAAGAGALLQSYAKRKTGAFLTVDALLRLLKESGDPVKDPRNGLTTPRVNIARAIAALDKQSQTTPPPPPQPEPAPAPPSERKPGTISGQELRDVLKLGQ